MRLGYRGDTRPARDTVLREKATFFRLNDGGHTAAGFATRQGFTPKPPLRNSQSQEPLAKFSDVVEKKQNGLILFEERAPRS